ncbi:hypothetical protein SDC9_103502 [bioreactor metagenome]|uniref:Uncharacterized protein n=1 Tax=bioreactor metagenome TaxID=1076179 RepID=A0A645B0L2_9ZZZZ
MTKYEYLQKIAADRDYNYNCYEVDCERFATNLIKGFMNYLGCHANVLRLAPYRDYDKNTSYSFTEAIEIGEDNLKRFGLLLILGIDKIHHIKFKIGKVNGKYYLGVGEENKEFYIEDQEASNLSTVYDYIYQRFEDYYKADINANI